jgi:hypothetical protein
MVIAAASNRGSNPMSYKTILVHLNDKRRWQAGTTRIS